MDELTIGDKIYISSKRAASITGYAKDYVGQLCREGHVEAKMVGRSWYVLESSIRAHRFGQIESSQGAEEEADGTVIGVRTDAVPAVIQEAAPRALPSTWEAPRYIAEEAPSMPVLTSETRISESYETAQSLDMSDERESLSEMQTAWKEWFESKQETVKEIEEEEESEPAQEPIKEEEEMAEEEVPVVVHKIQPVRQASPAKMDIQPVQAAVSMPQPVHAPQAPKLAYEPNRHRQDAYRRSHRGSNLVVVASLIAFAGIVIAIGYVGSGFGSPYMGTNPIIDYLGGASSIEK